MEKLEEILEIGGTKKEILFLVISGGALLISLFDLLPLRSQNNYILRKYMRIVCRKIN